MHILYKKYCKELGKYAEAVFFKYFSNAFKFYQALKLNFLILLILYFLG